MKKAVNKQQRSTRREFLRSTATGLALFSIGPATILGGPNREAPSDKLQVACIGVGGRGRASVNACRAHQILGLCDVDDRKSAGAFKDFPQAKQYRDFRKMLDELDSKLDAVTVGTPDHTHTVAALDAIRRKKHVYCEKPLAHTIREVRTLMAAAREHQVITQLGNQGHSSGSIRDFCEWIWDGAIGNVTEVHACCDAFPHVYCQIDKMGQLSEKHEIPKELDYDLWVGPASFRPYSPLWVPWNWRGWMNFGTGCIGDWICHVVDPSFWALDLGHATSVRAEVQGYDPEKHAEVYPRGVKITFQFPAKGKRGPVKLIWFDGSERPPRPEVLDKGRNIHGTGAVVYGDKGVIMHGSHGAGGVEIIPSAKMKEYKRPEQKIPRVPGHHQDWLEAIRTGRQAGSSFDYGGPLTELGLLGAIAIRFPTRELQWDAEKMRFTNCDEANHWVHPPYREGWSL